MKDFILKHPWTQWIPIFGIYAVIITEIEGSDSIAASNPLAAAYHGLMLTMGFMSFLAY